MADKLAGKVAFVGGGGSRVEGAIGRVSAELYAQEGARVFVADIDEDAAAATVAAITRAGGSAEAGVGDLADPEAVARLAREATVRFGRVDILHNNIAVTRTGAPEDLSLEDWNESWRVNVTSIFLACKEILPFIESAGGGAVVNISSIAASRYLGVPYHAYYATKAAVSQLTRSLAVDYASRGIRVNSVSPGFIATPNTGVFRTEHATDAKVLRVTDARPHQTPMRRRGTALDVARAALFLVSEDAAYVTGADIAVDGGLAAIAVLPPS